MGKGCQGCISGWVFWEHLHSVGVAGNRYAALGYYQYRKKGICCTLDHCRPNSRHNDCPFRCALLSAVTMPVRSPQLKSRPAPNAEKATPSPTLLPLPIHLLIPPYPPTPSIPFHPPPPQSSPPPPPPGPSPSPSPSLPLTPLHLLIPPILRPKHPLHPLREPRHLAPPKHRIRQTCLHPPPPNHRAQPHHSTPEHQPHRHPRPPHHQPPQVRQDLEDKDDDAEEEGEDHEVGRRGERRGDAVEDGGGQGGELV